MGDHMPITDMPACRGKETFMTFDAANMILKRMRQRIAGKSSLGIYRCPACRQFHIGNQKKELHSTERRTRKYGKAQMSAM
jgi:hypothetical protein